MITSLEALQQQCLSLKNAHIVLSCEESKVNDLIEHRFYGLQDIPLKPFHHWKGDYSLPSVPSQGRIVSAPVAFTAMMFPSIPYSHPDSALLSLGSEIMENEILHKRIREQGGAYGSGAVHAALSGQFYLFSYRDPNLSSTLSAFHEAISDVSKGKFEESNVDEAKLGMIQELDSPCAPGSRAMTAYCRLRSGRTPEKRQLFRKKVLSATSAEIERAMREHLLPEWKKGITVCFAGKELFDKELPLLPSPLPLFAID